MPLNQLHNAFYKKLITLNIGVFMFFIRHLMAIQFQYENRTEQANIIYRDNNIRTRTRRHLFYKLLSGRS